MQIYKQINGELISSSLSQLEKIDASTYYSVGDNIVSDSELPVLKKGQALIVSGNRNEKGHFTVSANVKVVPDFRGQTAYRKDDGNSVEITELGELDDVLTLKKPPTPYHTFKNNKWVLTTEAKNKQLQDAIQQASIEIDGAVVSIYNKFNQFTLEYQLRESQAIAFRENKYKGDVPEQVAAYAEPAGLPPKVACEHILTSAHKLREALSTLGKLRMKKVHLPQNKTVTEVENEKTAVLMKIQEIAEAL